MMTQMMSQCGILLAGAVAAFSWTAFDDAARAADDVPPRLSAAGTVVDVQGQPLPGVRVVLREWSNTRYNEDLFNRDVRDILAETTTDAQGRFQFDKVASRPFSRPLYNNLPWDVVALADGFGMAWVHLAQHESTQPVTIRLAPQGEVTGQIVGPEDEPVADAKVQVWSIDPPGSEWSGRDNDPDRIDIAQSELSPTATTDKEGRFVLTGLPADRRMGLVVEHPNYATDYLYVATAEGPQPGVATPGGAEPRPVHNSGFTHRLQRGGQVRGQVKFVDDGRPYAGAKLTASAQSRVWHETANGEGRFLLTGIPVGEYSLLVQAPKDSPYLHARSTVIIGEETWQPTVEFALDAGIEVRGTVRDEESGDAVSGVQVTYFSEGTDSDSNWSPAQPATSGSEGGFVLAVPPGRGVLRVGGGTGIHPTHDVPDFWRLRQVQDPPPGWSADIDVSPSNAPQDVELTVGRGLVIRGRIVDSQGEPVSGASVVASDQFRIPDRERKTTTDGNGRFELSGFLASSEQTLEIAAADDSLRGSVSVEADESAVGSRTVLLPDTALLPTGTVTGKVFGDGEPLAGAQVTLSVLTGKSEHGGFSTRHADSTTTDEDGRYRFTGIEAGKEIFVSVSHADYTDAGSRGYFKLEANQERELEPMNVQSRVAHVAGVVVDPEGNPVAGATVSVSRRNGGSISNAFTRDPTGADGRFHIKGLPDVPLEVMAYIRPSTPTKDSYIRFPAYVEAEPGDDQLRIVLDPKLQRPLP